MKHNTALTFRLPDGSLCNPLIRWHKHRYTLMAALAKVPDPRQNQGKRHSLVLILSIPLLGSLAGYSTLKDCLRWVTVHPEFLRFLTQAHGLPHATTIARVLAKCETSHLQIRLEPWYWLLTKWQPPRVVSLDGKTMCGVRTTPVGGSSSVTRHILSLFSHGTHQTIAQIGVDSKENEIPAGQRLLKDQNLTGLTIVADALHTQVDTAGIIRKQGGDYLLMVKGNQESLADIIARTFDDPLCQRQTAIDRDISRGRDMTTEISSSQSVDLKDLGKQWQDIHYVGKIHRWGVRTEKGKVTAIDETVYWIASHKRLRATKALKMIRGHWEIENNLHWQKDYTYAEDKQRLSQGQAPQVMTYLRSLCIGLLKLLGFESITDTVKACQVNARYLQTILRVGMIV